VATLGLPHRLPLGLIGGFAAGVVAGPLAARRLTASVLQRATLLIAAAGSCLAVARGVTAVS